MCVVVGVLAGVLAGSLRVYAGDINTVQALDSINGEVNTSSSTSALQCVCACVCVCARTSVRACVHVRRWCAVPWPLLPLPLLMLLSLCSPGARL